MYDKTYRWLDQPWWGRGKQLTLTDIKTYHKTIVIKCDKDKRQRSMKKNAAQRQTLVFISK